MDNRSSGAEDGCVKAHIALQAAAMNPSASPPKSKQFWLGCWLLLARSEKMLIACDGCQAQLCSAMCLQPQALLAQGSLTS
eukprot:4842581-Amphidinium_carterae.2